MKIFVFIITFLGLSSFSGELTAQDSKTNCVFLKVGADKPLSGVIHYNLDRNGDPYVTQYHIFGLENGSGEFYQRKQYPMTENETIGGVTYRYSMPINGVGKAFFNMVCEKCR
jgi:hypothetical protein